MLTQRPTEPPAKPAVNERQKAVQAWMESLPLVTDFAELDAVQSTALLRLLSSGSGLEPLLGLLMAEKQALMVQLSHTVLDNSGAAARASVLQGKIQGIERIRETILEFVHVAGKPATTGAKD